MLRRGQENVFLWKKAYFWTDFLFNLCDLKEEEKYLFENK